MKGFSHDMVQKQIQRAKKKGLRGTKPRSYKNIQAEKQRKQDEFEKALQQAKRQHLNPTQFAF